ncbi:MAG: Histidine kinase [Nocardia sp.]|uniref:sensor histidine kinase n=1 Tax=Nocardia sp. TaxID=1821 RepID=UPI00262530A3|nr:histidine kinase [Nocardia sp.]MCU1641107.1 Histidine kinase [Nocardia sp.]
MNVTSATPGIAGRTLLDLRPRDVADRSRRFVRHPVGEYRRYVEEMEFDYPVAAVFLVDVILIATGTGAVIQRALSGNVPNAAAFLALAMVYVAGPPCVVLSIPPRPLLFATVTMSAVALFLVQPVPVDVAPLILVAASGEIAAITATVASVPIAAAMIAELVFFGSAGHLDGLPWFCFGIVFGWMTGQMLNYQRRYLYQERENQEVRAVQAADDERRRIAREVHDVIAHSLSITLLHVTAARHALATDRDVDDAVDALTDAERLGRQAMADIRRTVGLLGQRPALELPEPGLDDVDDLVADFVRAGMPVGYRLDGDPSGVTPGVGLALYRICQESLANIAKHAPGASAQLRIALCSKDIELTVTNSLPTGVTARPGRGMGISGMRQRIALLGGTLTADRAGEVWQVQAHIPLSGQTMCVATVAEDSLRTVLSSMARKTHDRLNPMGSKEIQEGV